MACSEDSVQLRGMIRENRKRLSALEGQVGVAQGPVARRREVLLLAVLVCALSLMVGIDRIERAAGRFEALPASSSAP